MWNAQLDEGREQLFVGRDREMGAFEDFLTDPTLRLFHLHGPAGSGKSALLREWLELAARRDIPTVHFDAPRLTPLPPELESTILQRLDESPSVPQLLALDDFDALEPLYDWLRGEFFPALPARLKVVTVARNPLPERWRTELGWQAVMRSTRLEMLDESTSHEYLEKRGVPERDIPAVIELTAGLPAALTLAADAVENRVEPAFKLPEAYGYLRPLAQRELWRAPSELHRRAIWLSSLVWRTTDSILDDVVVTPSRQTDIDAHQLLEWLSGLECFRWDSGGILPEQPFRNLLAADIAYRDPTLHGRLVERARRHLLERCHDDRPQLLEQRFFELFYLLRDELPVDTETLTESRTLRTEAPSPQDVETFTAQLRASWGEEAVEIAERWRDVQPDELTVVRSDDQQVCGFVQSCVLDSCRADGPVAEPAVDALRETIGQESPLRAEEQMRLVRFWLPLGEPEEVAATQWRLQTYILSQLASPAAAAVGGIAVQRPGETLADRLMFDVLAEFEADGQGHQILGFDWRRIDRDAWLDRAWLALSKGSDALSPSDFHRSISILGRDDFGDAIEAALKDFHSGDRLLDNPLLQTKLVADAADDQATATEHVELLRDLLRSAIDQLGDVGEDGRHAEILEVTYLQPDTTQLAASNQLNMSYSTYRRHLKRATGRVVRRLWERELRSA